MSNAELGSGNMPQMPLYRVERQLAEFVTQAAEIDTVFDYRYGGKKLVRKKLDQIFSSHEFANEAVSIVPSYGVSKIVDYSSGQTKEHEGPILGYMNKFYPVPEVFDIPSITPQAIEDGYLSESGVDPWDRTDNPLSVQLGLRLKPVFVPDGYSPEHTFVEVLSADVEQIDRAVEMHPFQIENAVFEDQSTHILQYGPSFGLTPDSVAKRLSKVAAELEDECQFIGKILEVDFYPEVVGLLSDDLASARAFIANSESEDQTFPEAIVLKSGKSSRALVLGFDWLWAEEVDDDTETDAAQLYVTLNMRGPNQRAEIISVPVGGIRFGNVLDTLEYKYQTDQKVFAADYQMFIRSMGNLPDEVRSQGNEAVIDAAQVVLRFINQGDLLQSAVQKTFRLQSRTIESEVGLHLNQSVTLKGWWLNDTNGRMYDLLTHDYQEITGIVQKYIANVHVHAGGVTFEMACLMDVSQNKYYKAIGVNTLAVPLRFVESSQFIVDGTEPYPHSN